MAETGADSSLRWRVLAVVFLSGFMVYGGGLYSFVLFITPWTREFGWSRAATAGLVSAFYLGAPFILLAAPTIRRVGANRLLLLGVGVEASSLFLLCLAHGYWQMYLLRAFMGLGKVMFAVCLPVILARWFRSRLSLALSIAWAGWNLGGLVLGPLTSLVMDRYGWRVACAMIASGLVGLALLPPLWLLRVGTGVADPAGSAAPPARTEIPSGGVLASGAYRLIVLGTAAFYTSVAGLVMHQAALVESAGFSAATAAAVLGMATGIAALTGPWIGEWLDRGCVARTVLLMHLVLLGSVLTLGFVAGCRSVVLLGLYAVMFGVTLGGCDVTWVALLRCCFPSWDIARMYSVWYFVEVAVLAFAPVGVGRIYDLTGSYRISVLVLAVPAIASLGCVLANATTRRQLRRHL